MSMRLTLKHPTKRVFRRYVIDPPFPSIGDTVRLRDESEWTVAKLEPTEIIARFLRPDPAIQFPEAQQKSTSGTEGGPSDV